MYFACEAAYFACEANISNCETGFFHCEGTCAHCEASFVRCEGTFFICEGTFSVCEGTFFNCGEQLSTVRRQMQFRRKTISFVPVQSFYKSGKLADNRFCFADFSLKIKFMKQAASKIPNPTPDFQTAVEAFKHFLGKIDKQARVVCLHDSDADGVTAGVVWELAMRRLGFENVRRILPTRERNAWGAETRPIIEKAAPEFLFVLDLGSQPAPLFGDAPVCFIDHHRPGGALEKDVLISAYNWNPVPNTSLIVYDLFQSLIDVADFDWIAAIGVQSDLGDKAPFELLAAAKKKYTAKYLKEATTLINAARRAAHYEPETAAQALLKTENPKALVNSDLPEVERLREAREEVKAELEEAKKQAPKFAGNVALLRINSPCQIHPLIAQIWRSRLPAKFIVICANSGFIPGRINFAARSHSSVSALDFLRSIDLKVTEGSYAQGHDQATGGSLPIEKWNEFLAKLGFPEEVFEK